MPKVEEILGASGRTFEWMARINGLLLLRAHGEPLERAVAAMRAVMNNDEQLGIVLAKARADSDFQNRLDAFLSATGKADYERLVSEADAAKEVLRRARSAGRES